jgi:hypothetical protein
MGTAVCVHACMCTLCVCVCVYARACACMPNETLKILRCVLDIHIGSVLFLIQCVDVNLCSVSKNSITFEIGYTFYFLKLQAGGPSITIHLQHQLLMKVAQLS